MRKTAILAATLFLLVLATAAAHSVDSSFSATLKGELAGELRGPAVFGVAPGPTDAPGFFSITMGASSEEGAVVFTRLRAQRLVPGSYHVDPEGELHALVVTGSMSHPTGVFHAVSGVLTVTSSSASQMHGVFTLEATGFLSASPEIEDRALRVQGVFDASAR